MNQDQQIDTEPENQEAPKTIFFTCGQIVSRDIIVIPAQYNALPDEDISRVAMKFGDDWGYLDVDTDVIGSVTFDRGNRTLWLFGRHGSVISVSSGSNLFTRDNIKGNFIQEHIPIHSYGEILCSRYVGDRLIACGQSTQIYERTEIGWTCMDSKLRVLGSPAVEGIDGFSHREIYCVGEKGLILYFNGHKWIQLDSPTNQTLSAVRCVDENSVFVCGNNGTFLQGSKMQWHQIEEVDAAFNFWDIEYFNGKVYLAHSNGILSYDGKVLSPVDFDVGRQVRCHKLQASDGVLWSFGVDDLLCFDNNKWHLVLCPHNL